MLWKAVVIGLGEVCRPTNRGGNRRVDSLEMHMSNSIMVRPGWRGGKRSHCLPAGASSAPLATLGKRRRRGVPVEGFFVFVLILVFITRYMRPGGPWQRLSRCPLRSSGGFFIHVYPFSYPEPACAVIVRCP